MLFCIHGFVPLHPSCLKYSNLRVDLGATSFAEFSSSMIASVSSSMDSSSGSFNSSSSSSNFALDSDLHMSDTLVFIAGIIPFAWATVEFWRRIAVGESFGTGKDSVVIIGEDDVPQSSRGRRTLGKGALVAAYILFGIAIGVLGLTFASILNSPPEPMILPSSSIDLM